MIHIKTADEIELMRESALVVSKTLGMLAAEIKPGVTSLYLDKLAETFIRDHGTHGVCNRRRKATGAHVSL